jgi:hypothetical protein
MNNNNDNNKFHSIELLNSEGCLLKATRTDKGFIITDQYKEIIALLDKDNMKDFTRGNINLYDSKRHLINYTKYPGSMKPDLKELDLFIGLDIEGVAF